MNTIAASNSNVRFTLDFFKKTITGTKASFNKANKGFGPEYEELTAKMAAHPDFELRVKEQKTKTTKAKRTYEGIHWTFGSIKIGADFHPLLIIILYNITQFFHTHTKDCPRYQLPRYM